MAAVHVEVTKITFYPPSKGYAVLLQEIDGTRQLPVIVGAFEAQAIALALEKIEMPRPMTHDLLSNIMETLDVDVTAIIISDLTDGTFYAKIIADTAQFGEQKIDSRPSDAIALALRVDAPIYVESVVLEEAGVAGERGDEDDGIPIDPAIVQKELTLEDELKRAIEVENYELAAVLRDKIQAIQEDKEKK